MLLFYATAYTLVLHENTYIRSTRTPTGRFRLIRGLNCIEMELFTAVTRG